MSNGAVSHNPTVNDRVASGIPTSNVLNQGSVTLLNHMQMDPNPRVPVHNSFAPVLPTSPQVLQKPPTDAAMNPMLLSYLTSTSVPHPHSLLSLDPGIPPPQHGHLEQSMNGLHPQQQFMLPTVHTDQYDPQNSYMGVPYQQQIFYPRAPGPYYFYP